MEKSKGMPTVEEGGFFTILFDLFRSLKLTIFLLILLAILSIIGTVITQNAPSSDYIQRYGIRLYEVLNFFSLFDMYHSWWFSAILLLLVINLIACSLKRLPGVWRQIFRESDSKELVDATLKILPYVEKIRDPNLHNAKSEEAIRSNLKIWFSHPERIETESSITLFSEKGKFSRLGVYITHLSIIVILIGGILGSLYGFKGHVEILEGETVDRILLRIKDEEVPKPIDFSVRCDDFNITYYDLKGPEKHIKEYSSLITILENGKQALQKTVIVNHPLHYKGLSFYQSSYGALHDITLGIQFNDKDKKEIMKAFEGETVPIPNSETFIRILKYVPQVHNFGEGVQVVLSKPNQEPQAHWLLKDFPKFDQQRGDEFFLTFEGATSREYTGLQVTKDPGVWIVWGGSGLMIFGIIVSFFFSHQRVWVRVPKDPAGEVVLAGSTNKNRIGFEKKFGELVNGVRSLGINRI
jgi:cytochrome c biogenesis protein